MNMNSLDSHARWPGLPKSPALCLLEHLSPHSILSTGKSDQSNPFICNKLTSFICRTRYDVETSLIGFAYCLAVVWIDYRFMLLDLRHSPLTKNCDIFIDHIPRPRDA